MSPRPSWGRDDTHDPELRKARAQIDVALHAYDSLFLFLDISGIHERVCPALSAVWHDGTHYRLSVHHGPERFRTHSPQTFPAAPAAPAAVAAVAAVAAAGARELEARLAELVRADLTHSGRDAIRSAYADRDLRGWLVTCAGVAMLDAPTPALVSIYLDDATGAIRHRIGLIDGTIVAMSEGYDDGSYGTIPATLGLLRAVSDA